MSAWEIESSIALLLAILSLWFHFKAESLRSIAGEMRALSLEVAELSDRTATWIKRESVRRAREVKDETPSQAPLIDSSNRKAQIRERARARGLMT